MLAILGALISRLRFASARRRLDNEARVELEAHLDLLVERYTRSGMMPEAARAAARQQLGNLTQAREEVYTLNGIAWVDAVAGDLRYASRQLRRSPGFSAVVIATLALGIGGTTAVFSVLEAVLIAPLPYELPGQLVRLYQQEPNRPDTQHYLTGAHFSLLRDSAASFQAVTALANYRETGRDLVTNGRAQRLRVLRVTSDYFDVLRFGSLRGPGFERRDEVGAHRVVLSNGIWRSVFGGAPSIVGSNIQLSGEAYEVVGISSPGFEDPIAGDVDAWVPYALARDTDAENNSLSVVGRLRSGISLAQAGAELSSLSRSMKGLWPQARRSAVVAVPLQ